MPIVSSFTSFITPDVFLREATPAPTIRGSSIGVVGVVLQSIRGPVNTPTLVGSLSDFGRIFGAYDSTLPEGYMFAYNFFNQGANQLNVVRVTDGTDTAASGRFTDSSSGMIFQVQTTGTWGNAVTMTAAANAASGYVDLTFQYGATEKYTYKQVTFTNINDARYIVTVLQNDPTNFVQVAVVSNTANPGSGTITFTNGSNGTNSGAALTDASYTGTNTGGVLTGLVCFEADTTVNFVTTARSTETLNAAISTHVTKQGLTPRMGIAAPIQGTTVATVVTNMASYNNDQMVYTFPWLQILNPNNNKKEYYSPVAFYAGLLSTLSYEQSPSRRQILGIVGTEKPLAQSDVDTLTSNRVSPITLLAGQGFVVRNGYNTSSNPSLANITRRRAANFFAIAFANGSQQFVSKPHTIQLRNDVKSAFSGLLQNEVTLGRIGNVAGGKPFAVKCDDQNNPLSSVQAGRLMVDVQISLWSPADFILITMDASEAKVVSLQ